MKRSDKAFAFTLLLLLGVCVVGVLIYSGKSGSPSVLATFLPAPVASGYSAEPESSVSSEAFVFSSSAREAPEKTSSSLKSTKSKAASSSRGSSSSSSRSSSRAPQASSASSERSGGFHAEESEPVTERININEATVEQLEDLLHFNHLRAMTIVQYREQNGPFESLSELLEFDESDDLTLELLAELFTV